MIILWGEDNKMFVTDSTGRHYRAACLYRLKVENDMAESVGLGRPYVLASNQDGKQYYPSIRLKKFSAWK